MSPAIVGAVGGAVDGAMAGRVGAKMGNIPKSNSKEWPKVLRLLEERLVIWLNKLLEM